MQDQVSIRDVAYKCRCPKAVVKSGAEGQLVLSTTLRVGHNPKCKAHPTSTFTDRDRLEFETPASTPSARC